MHGGLSSAFLPSSFINDAQRLVICLFNSLTLFYCSSFMTHRELCGKHSSSASHVYGNTISARPGKSTFDSLYFAYEVGLTSLLLFMFPAAFKFLRKWLTQLCCMLKRQLTCTVESVFCSPLSHFIAAPMNPTGIRDSHWDLRFAIQITR